MNFDFTETESKAILFCLNVGLTSLPSHQLKAGKNAHAKLTRWCNQQFAKKNGTRYRDKKKWWRFK